MFVPVPHPSSPIIETTGHGVLHAPLPGGGVTTMSYHKWGDHAGHPLQGPLDASEPETYSQHGTYPTGAIPTRPWTVDQCIRGGR